ncbi:MAG: hypothetical protein AAB567_03285 [Patescibacteria group bacterium]
MSKKILFLSLGVIVLAAVSGANIAFYTRTWDPQWNPFRPSPEQALFAAVQKMQEVKTFHSSTKLTIDAKDQDQAAKFSIHSESDTDRAGGMDSRSQASFVVEVFAQGVSFAVEGEQRSMGTTSFLKITSIPPSLEPFLSLFGIQQNALVNQWIKIDMQELMKFFGAQGGLPPEILQEQLQKRQRFYESLSELLNNEKFYEGREELKDEEIHGQKMYRYLFHVKLGEFLREFVGRMFEELEEEGLSEQMEEQISRELQDMSKVIGDIPFEVWISRRDSLPYRIKMEKTLGPEELGQLNENSENAGTVSILFQIDFSDFNRPVFIEAPEDAKNLQDILPLFNFSPPTVPLHP